MPDDLSDQQPAKPEHKGTAVLGKGTDGEWHALQTDSNGVLATSSSGGGGGPALATVDSTDSIVSGTTALTVSFATIVASSSGATQLVAGVSSKKIKVLSLALVANAAVNVKFQDATPTDETGLFYLAANGGFVLPYNPKGWFQTGTGEALDINLSGAVAVGGCLTYVAE